MAVVLDKIELFVHRHKMRALMAFLALYLIASLFPVLTAYADEPDDWSFYNVSSAAAAFYGQVSADKAMGNGNSDEQFNVLDTTHAGRAGGFLGFNDGSTTLGQRIIGWVAPNLSTSSQAYGYNRLDGSAMHRYSQYGNLLTQLGLDSTQAGMSLNFGRAIGGFIMRGMYLLASAIPLLFAACVRLLRFINPFHWILGALTRGSFSTTTTFALPDYFADGLTAQGVGNVPVDAATGLGPLVGLIISIYSGLQSISWMFLIPISIASIVVGFLLFRSTDRMGKLKRLLIRMVFITIGIPLLGLIYTSMLNDFEAELRDSSNGVADRIIFSTFVDFAGWVEGKEGAGASRDVPPRLGIIPGMTIGGTLVGSDTGGSRGIIVPTAASWMNLRNTAMAINGRGGDVNTTFGANDARNASQAWNQDVEVTGGTRRQIMDSALDLLDRYSSAEFYLASTFEENIKLELSATEEQMNNFFKELQKPQEFHDNHEDIVYRSYEGSPLNIFSDGWLHTGTLGNTTNYNYGQAGTAGGGAAGSAGLSTMAMYNYLSTKFGMTNMIVYSNKIASSGAVREMHMSVNLIGKGFVSFLYWLQAFSMLLTITLIGLFYAIGLLFSNFMKGLRMLTSIPFSLLGFLPAIAKVISIVIAMIIEVLAILFMYFFLCEFLWALHTLVEGPIAALFSGAAGPGMAIAGASALVMAGPSLLTILILLNIIITIGFMIMSIKFRKSITKGINEAIEKVVEKFIVGQPGQSSGGGFAGKAGGAVAAGAGMALGAKMMGGSSDGGKNPDTAGAPGSSSGGPGGVGAGSEDGGGSGGSGGQGGDANVTVGTGAGGEGNGLGGSDDADKALGGSEMSGSPLAISAPQGDPTEPTAKDQAAWDDATGKNSMTDTDERKEDEAKQKIEGTTEAVKEGAQAVAKGVQAYYTGDVQAGVEAVQHAEKAKKGVDKAKNAEEDAAKRQQAEKAQEAKEQAAAAAAQGTGSDSDNDGTGSKANDSLASASTPDTKSVSESVNEGAVSGSTDSGSEGRKPDIEGAEAAGRAEAQAQAASSSSGSSSSGGASGGGSSGGNATVVQTSAAPSSGTASSATPSSTSSSGSGDAPVSQDSGQGQGIQDGKPASTPESGDKGSEIEAEPTPEVRNASAGSSGPSSALKSAAKDVAMNAAMVYAASSSNPTVAAAGQGMLASKMMIQGQQQHARRAARAQRTNTPPPPPPRRPTQKQRQNMPPMMRSRVDNFVKNNEASNASDIEKAAKYNAFVNEQARIAAAEYNKAQEQNPDDFSEKINAEDVLRGKAL